MSAALRVYRGLTEAVVRAGLPRVFIRGSSEDRAERVGWAPVGGEPAPLWIHAASVGEVAAAEAFFHELRTEGDRRMALSTVTATGRRSAARLTPEVGPFLAPLDAPTSVRRAMDRVAPSALVLLETELWPNLILAAVERSIPWAIASGRLSSRTLGAPQIVRSVYRELLPTAAAVAARSAQDADGFVELGASVERVQVTGDLKEDRRVPDFASPPQRPHLLAACTRPGEEELVLDTFDELTRWIPEGTLTIAPRHPERFETVVELVQSRGLSPCRWRDRGSDDTAAPAWRIVVVDEMGVLDEAYRECSMAFVGGSFRDFGGHSPLEAASAGRLVVMGPFTTNCHSAVELLEGAGACARFTTAAEFRTVIIEALNDFEKLERCGRAARDAVLDQSGAAKRTRAFLEERGVL